MITLDLSILNQKGTPMFNSDLFANRPAAGIVGRIFISTDTKVFFRDTGTTWEELSGSSFSGSLATGQVAFGSATNTISGTNNLFWNNANANLGIGSNAVNSVWKLGVDGNIATTGAISLGPITGSGSNAFFEVTSTQLRIYAHTSRYISFSANATEFARLSTAGNLTLGTTLTDNGNRLQVYGDSFFRTSDAGSTTNGFRIQNSISTDIFVVRNSGIVKIGDGAVDTTIPTNVLQINTGLSYWAIRNNFNLEFVHSNATLTPVLTIGVYTGYTPGVIYSNLRLSRTFANGSANNAAYNSISINDTINQTGGAFGITRGLYVNPTLTAAADFRSIQWDNNTGWGLYGAGTALNYLGGTLGIKTTSPYAPSTFSLDVNGGLLVKNTAGTTAQITLINADPSIGGNNGFLVASVGGTSGGSFVDLQGYYGTSITGSTALRLNPAGGAVIVNSTTNTGEQFQLTGTLRINGQSSGTSGGNSGQHLIINLDGTTYKIKLELP